MHSFQSGTVAPGRAPLDSAAALEKEERERWARGVGSLSSRLVWALQERSVMDGNLRTMSAASCSVPTRLDLSSISATLDALQSRLSPGESVLLELDKHATLTPLLAAWLLAFRRLLGTRRRVALAPVSALDDEAVRKLALYELFELYPSADAARRALRVTA